MQITENRAPKQEPNFSKCEVSRAAGLFPWPDFELSQLSPQLPLLVAHRQTLLGENYQAHLPFHVLRIGTIPAK
jgi:hypothetical protein